ncbi:hypothetical protein SKAU_G00394200 [Synaphobranchus kaupii]|uniref:Uncharacterized protein n=1 Tax=Synaphobranchus kaupii TaxID=118154 RepID=A0A9Q1IDW6_SYNKA|nr:hypothetical protein SKAU_G00394200 [Synaphobranchus kaupii]
MVKGFMAFRKLPRAPRKLRSECSPSPFDVPQRPGAVNEPRLTSRAVTGDRDRCGKAAGVDTRPRDDLRESGLGRDSARQTRKEFPGAGLRPPPRATDGWAERTEHFLSLPRRLPRRARQPRRGTTAWRRTCVRY